VELVVFYGVCTVLVGMRSHRGCGTRGFETRGKHTANLFAVPAQFEIFGNRDLLSRSVKKM